MTPGGGPGAGAGGAGQCGAVELLGDLDRPCAWMLLVGGVAQSHVDLDDPLHLEFEYVRRLGHVIDLAAPPGTPLRVLHLGGGGLTLARYVAATRPGSEQLAVEADRRVAHLVSRRLPLGPPGARHATAAAGADEAGPAVVDVVVADARAAVGSLAAGRFDVVVADVFAAGQTPAHLTSAEFVAEVARTLRPQGVFAVNVGDGPPLAHARGRIAAIGSVFAHACVIAEPAVLHGRSFGNLVVVAAGHRLPAAELARRVAADPFPARLLAGATLDGLVAGARPITDAGAEPSPVPPPGAFA